MSRFSYIHTYIHTMTAACLIKLIIIICFKVIMQGKLTAVAYTLRKYWNQFSLGRICKQEDIHQWYSSIRGKLKHLIMLILIIHIIVSYDQNIDFLCERWIPCQAVTSVLCLHYRPETVHCSTKDAYTSEITIFTLLYFEGRV